MSGISETAWNFLVKLFVNSVHEFPVVPVECHNDMEYE